jgi:hypothetical protein
MKQKNKKLSTSNEVNTFKEAVERTEEIKEGYCSGLRALKKNSKYIQLGDPKKCKGSVNIDDCVKNLYPHASRWDYAVGYERNVYYIEIHPGETSEVDEVIKKSDWLRGWLKTSAPALKELASASELYWIPSGRYAILRNSCYEKRLAQKGIRVKSSPMRIPTE